MENKRKRVVKGHDRNANRRKPRPISAGEKGNYLEDIEKKWIKKLAGK